MRPRIIPVLSILLLIILGTAGVPAQETNAADSAATLRAKLEKKKADAERMGRMIDALNQVDSLYKLRYPTWVVLDPDISERVRRAFRVRNIAYPPAEDVQVVANPDAGEIVEISIGGSRMGRVDTRSFLSDSLYADILAGNYGRRMIDARPKERTIGQLYGVRPQFAAAYASAFGAGILISNGWGAEAKMGFEEIGYHFWSTGSVRGLAVFDQFKIGVVIPIVHGTSPYTTQPLDIRSRKLTGAIGFASELSVPWNDQSVNALLSVGDITRVTDYRLLTDSVNIDFLHTVAQLSYSKEIRLNTGQYLTVTGGLGYHQIAHAQVQTDLSVLTTDKEDFVSPLLRVEYVNRVSNMFGASAQIYSSIVHLKGWVEIVRNLVFIDLQYYSPLFRDPKPWEQPYFFMISPRLQVIY